jgi:predicted NAD/FAD-dependent oxidoreductase
MTVDPILIIGAGIAGLTAAQVFKQADQPVLVLDKGRSVGGRMATRRFGGGRFDHGAQYFTGRSERFKKWISEWQAAGVVTEWARGFAMGHYQPPALGHPRYRGLDGMTTITKYLARDLDVRVDTNVVSVSKDNNQWLIHTKSGKQFRGHALLLTPPVPQSLDLLYNGQVSLPDDVQNDLAAITYDSCLALMALFAGHSLLPEPGGLRLSDGPIAWIADNFQKGISPGGFGVTIHAAPEFSRQHWQTESAIIAQELLKAAAKWLHKDLIKWQLHRWRYSQPTMSYSEPTLFIPGPPALAFAGDAFGGPRVEGAASSGYAAAKALLSTVNE